MVDIEMKLLELAELLNNIPEECKGPDNSDNRRKYMKIKCTIHNLISEL